VAEHEENYLAQCLQAGICPACTKATVTKYGTGRFEDGVFCSFDCYTKWHAGALIRKHQDSGKQGAGDE